MTAQATRQQQETDLRRGYCPTLGQPMPTGDGLLARLRPLDCAVGLHELRAIAAAAAEFGNGALEVTARGSLQVRGLAPETVPPFERAVLASGIVPATGVMVEVPPLAGLDPAEIIDPRPLAAGIRAAIQNHVPPLALAPKLAVVVDGGGRFHLGAVTADVRLTAVGEGEFLLAVGGTNQTARPVAVVGWGQAVGAVLGTLEAIAAIGPMARGRDLDPNVLGELYDPAASEITGSSTMPSLLGVHRLGAAPPSVLPDISPSRGEIGWGAISASISADGFRSNADDVGRALRHESISPLEGGEERSAKRSNRSSGSITVTNAQSDSGGPAGRTERGISLSSTKGEHILGIAFPYRQATAADIINLVETLEKLGVSEIRLSPGHGLFVTGLSAAAASQTEDAARRLGFWTSPNEPRADIALCSGTSGCASAFHDTRATAETLLASAPILLDGSFTIHLSGCAKGCAHPSAAPLTLVGTPSGYGLVVNGAASSAAARYIAAKDLGIALDRLAYLVAGAKETGETARDCLARLGADRIAAALELDQT